MTYEEVYAKVRSGEMLLSEFVVWCTDCHKESFDEGYQEGVDEQ